VGSFVVRTSCEVEERLPDGLFFTVPVCAKDLDHLEIAARGDLLDHPCDEGAVSGCRIEELVAILVRTITALCCDANPR
jgi:hypothetical protein